MSPDPPFAPRGRRGPAGEPRGHRSRERHADREEFEHVVDLHGLRPDQALRRLAQELHGARVRRIERMLVITGRGSNNEELRPVLRDKVEAWLRGPDGRGLGVRGFQRISRGGALELRLAPPGLRDA